VLFKKTPSTPVRTLVASYIILYHFNSFSNEETSQTSSGHNFSKSTAIALRFCTYSALELLCPNICTAYAHSAENFNFRARTFRPPRAAHKHHPHLLPNTLSSKGANQEVLLAVHPALRPPRSAPYRGERTPKLGEFIYHLCRANPPKLGRIRVDCENL
jgi:hypothetical protein